MLKLHFDAVLLHIIKTKHFMLIIKMHFDALECGSYSFQEGNVRIPTETGVIFYILESRSTRTTYVKIIFTRPSQMGGPHRLHYAMDGMSYVL